MRLWIAALTLFAAVAGPAWAQNTPGPTLTNVLKKGYVECAVAPTTPGFSFVDSKGEFRGLDADTCRAVAAAIFGDASKARFIPTAGAQRLPILQAGQVDLVVQVLTQTQTREAANGLLFTGVNFYDGQSFLVRKSSGVKRATDLNGASICVAAGSTIVGSGAQSAVNQAVPPSMKPGSRCASRAKRCTGFSAQPWKARSNP